MKRIKCILYILLFGLCVQAQTLVYLEHSETLHFDEKRLPDAQILRGDVVFRHDSMMMYCDSAYFYEQSNSLDAFGHVRFEQGDTLFGYGDKLFYDGNTKLARLRRHVRLVHGKDNPTILTTDSLNYDRLGDVAYYYSGGTIRDSLNTLRSIRGRYYPNSNQAIFNQQVHLFNPNFDLITDTLFYNTETKIADLVCPTKIVYEKETDIYSSRGQYNTDTERSLLLERSRVVHMDGKTMTGDTIYYDKRIGYGKIIGHMEMQDTIQQATLYGNFGEMFRDGEYGYATDSALMVDWSSEDYGYMHADTLFMEEVPYQHPMIIQRDSIWQDSLLVAQAPDTLWIDSTFHRMRAHHNVRVYRSDVQAGCDSISYHGRDSVMTLYKQPICWSEENQMSADTIYIYMRNGVVDYAHGIGNALSIQQEQHPYFNQMMGKEMFAYIRDGELRQVDVNGNALTIFYPKEEDGSFVGMNTTQSSFVKIFLQDQQIHHILFTSQTSGTLYPMDQIPAGKERLNGFFWADNERPRRPIDVFARPERTERPVNGAVSASELETNEDNDKATSPARKTRTQEDRQQRKLKNNQ